MYMGILTFVHVHLFECRRSVTLKDTARFLDSRSTFNRTVYDLDALADPTTKNEDNVPSAPSTICTDNLDTHVGRVSPEQQQGAGVSGAMVEGVGLTAQAAEMCGGEMEGSAGTACITSLQFESRFECGNLRKAIQVYVCKSKSMSCTCTYNE